VSLVIVKYQSQILKNILKFDDEEIRLVQSRRATQESGADPFQESRFPTIESRQMNKEVKKIIQDVIKSSGYKVLTPYEVTTIASAVVDYAGEYNLKESLIFLIITIIFDSRNRRIIYFHFYSFL
jgi:hypothetical protein